MNKSTNGRKDRPRSLQRQEERRDLTAVMNYKSKWQ
jgi:hypothetical protein